MDPAAKLSMVRLHDARAADQRVDRLDHRGRIRDRTRRGDCTFLVTGAAAPILQAVLDRLFS